MKLKITYSGKIFLAVIIMLTLASFCFSLKKKSEATVFEFLESVDMFSRRGNKSAKAPPKRNNTKPKGTSPSPKILDLKDPKVLIEDWLMISSDVFSKQAKFPRVNLIDGTAMHVKIGPNGQRMNENFQKAKSEGAKNAYQFWFKMRRGYLYYFASKGDLNILDSIYVKKIENIKSSINLAKDKSTCFLIIGHNGETYQLCALTADIKKKWMCSIQKYLNVPLAKICGKSGTSGQVDPLLVVKKKIQPLVIIPMQSPKCNEKFNFNFGGSDWECICHEGREQSPVNLPAKTDAILLNMKPLFYYNMIKSSNDPRYASEASTIMLEDGMIKIKSATDFGKIIAPDGGKFQAKEIVFHTPAEHQINGEKFDMEMQVIHYGYSSGDIAKQIVLSFLFKTKAGVYNKFIDKIDFFNLPNPLDVIRVIEGDIFIPQIFEKSDEPSSYAMKPFSFYTYQGSLTSPPCTERTVNYIVANPIQISGTVIQLFKEALSVPDLIGKQVFNFERNTEKKNNRIIQPINGRTVNFYDHLLFGCPEFVKTPMQVQKKGHYEKRILQKTLFNLVPGTQPSGFPGAFVVTEKEYKDRDN